MRHPLRTCLLHKARMSPSLHRFGRFPRHKARMSVNLGAQTARENTPRMGRQMVPGIHPCTCNRFWQSYLHLILNLVGMARMWSSNSSTCWPGRVRTTLLHWFLRRCQDHTAYAYSVACLAFLVPCPHGVHVPPLPSHPGSQTHSSLNSEGANPLLHLQWLMS